MLLQKRMNCSMCDDYGVCSGIQCWDHPLKIGKVKDMCDALDSGMWWGDIVCGEDAARIAAETPSERVLRMLKASVEDQKKMSALREFKTQKYVNRSTGKLMAKVNTPCRYANTKESTDKHGVVWPAGCEPHRKGICPYLHPGDAGYAERKRW